MTASKRVLKAIKLNKSLVLVIPKEFVVERKISNEDRFEAIWSSDSSIIVYKTLSGGKVEQERLAAIEKLKKEIQLIDGVQEAIKEADGK
ncbi:hypothetical protein JW988_03475 [Candidatus Bathyarchaeota archaeon]|nr:hypothetical protein [Candidatus Bathyarchaeota archaeon]